MAVPKTTETCRDGSVQARTSYTKTAQVTPSLHLLYMTLFSGLCYVTTGNNIEKKMGLKCCVDHTQGIYYLYASGYSHVSCTRQECSYFSSLEIPYVNVLLCAFPLLLALTHAHTNELQSSYTCVPSG